ncbi:MAG: PAS domain S-box protein [Deltaproteobacteria bacterium]
MKNKASFLLGPGEAAVGLISLVGLYVLSRYSYLAFHTVSELFSVVIGFSLFMLIWNSRRMIDNHYFTFIGIAFFFVAGFDLIHTLAYKNMDFFSGYGTNLPTQLWIAARYLESLSFLAAFVLMKRRPIVGRIFAVYTVLCILLLMLIFTGAFPDCHIEGVGLTRFKIASEYLISAILLSSLVLLIKKREEFDRDVLVLLALSIVLTIGSELAFTFYVGVFDLSNLIGHYLKILSFYLIYKAIIETGLMKPYRLMFRNLRERETALSESEARYHSLFRNMSEGFALHEIICDGEGTPCDYRFLDVNPSFEALTGLLRDEIVGRRMTEVLPGEDPKWIRLFGAVALTGVPVHFDNVAITLKRHYDVFAYCPAPRQFAVIFMDITDRKQAEALLQEKTVLLEEANRELESFSYSVSHDLRAPLRAIDGFSRMILRQHGDQFDENTRRQFDMIRDNARMMGILIDNLLAFSRIQKASMIIQPIDMQKAVAEVWGDIRGENPDRSVEVRMADLLPGCGDKSLIRQVLVNLLSNAVKFTRDRKPGLIEVSSYRDSDHVVYVVKDNGVGFSMAYYDKLFGVFQRLHSQEEFEGTGVGLAIVQRIVSRHGGRVWAEGQLDEGAVFYFSLPAAPGLNPEPAGM